MLRARSSEPLVLRQVCDVRPFQADRPLGRHIEQSDHVHQGRFSGAGRSHDGENFAALYVEADIADRRDGETIRAVSSVHGPEAEKWRDRRHDPNLIPSNSMPAGLIACPITTSLPSTNSPSLRATCSAPAAPTITGTRRSAPLAVRTHYGVSSPDLRPAWRRVAGSATQPAAPSGRLPGARSRSSPARSFQAAARHRDWRSRGRRCR